MKRNKKPQTECVVGGSKKGYFVNDGKFDCFHEILYRLALDSLFVV